MPHQRSREPAATLTEAAVAKIWCEVLQTDYVFPDEPFFDVGGHSLLLPKLAAELSNAAGSTVKIIDLFEHPTIRAQAKLLERKA